MGKRIYASVVPEPELQEFEKLQLQQSIETYRVQMSLLVQICTVLVVADATVAGFAIQQKLAGIFWTGLVFPLTMYLVIRIVYRLNLPVIATAVAIESRYCTNGEIGLVSLFVALGISPRILEQLRSIASLNEEQERLQRYSSLERPRFAGSSPTRIGIIIVVVIQVLGPFALHCFFGWNYFGFPKPLR